MKNNRQKSRASPKSRQASARRRKVRQSRPLHKRFFLNPLVIFFWLCVGVLLIGLTITVAANDLLISAKVSAPLLTESASIDTMGSSANPDTAAMLAAAVDPEHAIIMHNDHIILNGSCPENSYISATRNNIMAGSVMCVNDPVFTIQIELTPGLNQLGIQDYNLTDDQGPLTRKIYVYYDNRPPQSNDVGTVTKNGKPNIPAVKNPISLTSNTQSKIVKVGDTLNWQINIKGGTPPYRLHVDFGDGTSTTITSESGTVTISHIYKEPGGDHYNYKIAVTIKDANNAESYIQLMAIVRPKGQHSTNNLISDQTAGLNSLPARLKNWLWLAWPAYGVVALMTVSFWLGEQEEKQILNRLLHRPKRRTR